MSITCLSANPNKPPAPLLPPLKKLQLIQQRASRNNPKTQQPVMHHPPIQHPPNLTPHTNTSETQLDRIKLSLVPRQRRVGVVAVRAHLQRDPRGDALDLILQPDGAVALASGLDAGFADYVADEDFEFRYGVRWVVGEVVHGGEYCVFVAVVGWSGWLDGRKGVGVVG